MGAASVDGCLTDDWLVVFWGKSGEQTTKYTQTFSPARQQGGELALAAAFMLPYCTVLQRTADIARYASNHHGVNPPCQ